MGGTIIIHAGMPKAGSSAVQNWLRFAAKPLLDDHRTAVLVADPTSPDEIRFHRPGPKETVNSGWLVPRFNGATPEEKRRLGQSLLAGLGNAASEHAAVVISSEAFAHPIWQGDESFLEPWRELASNHPVRIAYYVRPQHAALEAAWRQWGYRLEMAPSTYLERRSVQLHYFETLNSMRQSSPQLSLEVRPFLRELLHDGDIIADFATTFLGIDPAIAPRLKRDVNLGLPLEVVNLLRYAPEGMLWSSPHDNRLLHRVKAAFAGSGPTVRSERITRAAAVLQAHCRTMFEDDNRRLIEELAWPIPHFVGPVEGLTDNPPQIEEIDELWEPEASAAERSAFFQVLASVVAD